MSDKLAIHHANKSFGSKRIYQDLSLNFSTGKNTVILGGSGCGKSVLLKTLLGLVPLDDGAVLLDGKEMNHYPRDEYLERFGMLFQGAALFDSLPIWENVAFRLLNRKDALSKKEARDIAIEKLQRVGMDAHSADLFPAEISGGMKKRVGLARAIASQPDIIFFDEPTTGLDPIMSGVINRLIREITDELGATAITVTHDMTSARHVGDAFALLDKGKVEWQGDLEGLDNPDNLSIYNFVHGIQIDESKTA